jgi:arginine decarboxylase
VGAYQEILGMRHNLFTYPNEANVEFDSDGNYQITELYSTQTINDILIDLDYDIDEIHRKLKNLIDSQNLKDEEKKELLGKLLIHLNDTVYLKK